MSEQITIRPSGFAPKWYKSDYPSYGNRNHAGNMRNIDLTNPNSMTQGKGATALTAGTETGAVTTLIKGILRVPTSDDVSFAIGGAKLYKFSSTAVVNTGNFPYTIVGSGAITGEDVCYYKGALYYSYNDAGATGNFGKYDLASNFTPVYGSTVPTGAAALQNAPHQMVSANQSIYIANGQYIAELDGTDDPYVFTADSLNFYNSSISVASIVWNGGMLNIATNKQNISGVNNNEGEVYTWTGYGDSSEGDPIRVNGRIGALYAKNGIVYIWYEGLESGTVKPTFGYLGGGRVIPLATFTGTMPEYYQVSELNDNIIWLSDNRVYLYGSVSEESTKLSQIMSTTRATGGGLATPFGKIIASSYASTNFNLDVESGYATDAYWYSMMFPVSGSQALFQIESIAMWVEEMSSGAKLDTTLRYDGGTSSKSLTQITYSTTKPTRIIIGKQNLPKVEDFRLELSYSNGSTTNPVSIKKIEITGSYKINK